MSVCKGCSNFLRSRRFQGCIGLIQVVGDDRHYVECGFGYNKHAIQNVRFISINCDEVTTKNNQNCISIHYYVVENWWKVPILVNLQQGSKRGWFYNLIAMLVNFVTTIGGLF